MKSITNNINDKEIHEINIFTTDKNNEISRDNVLWANNKGLEFIFK